MNARTEMVAVKLEAHLVVLQVKDIFVLFLELVCLAQVEEHTRLGPLLTL